MLDDQGGGFGEEPAGGGHRAFTAIKEIFNPEGLLNPAVIVAPARLDADLALHTPSDVLPVETFFTFPHDEDGFAGAYAAASASAAAAATRAA